MIQNKINLKLHGKLQLKLEKNKIYKILKNILYTHQPIIYFAKRKFNKYKPKTIVIVGSIGKTTTRTILSQILKNKWKEQVLVSNSLQASVSRLVSLILKLKQKHKIMVVEAAINYPNDMNLYNKILKPDIIIFTDIGFSHAKFFNSSNKEIIKEKIKILDNAKDSTIITEKNNPLIKFLNKNKRIITFEKNDFKFKTKLIGKHNYKNIASAVLAAKVLDCKNHDLRVLDNITNPKSRLEKIELKDFDIIDDSYSANPKSMKAFLETIKDEKAKRKLLVIGDMLELGKKENKYHKDIAKEIIQIKPEKVFLIGNKIKYTINELYKLGFKQEKVVFANNLEDLLNKILYTLQKGDLIGFKASNKINLTNIAKKLKKRFNIFDKPINLPVSCNGFFEIGSFNAKREERFHQGCDFPTKINSKVFSVEDGLVVFKGRKKLYGNIVIIQHKNNIQSWYAHLNKIYVKKNQIVKKGDFIGLVGRSGNVPTDKSIYDYTHLHFEIRRNNKVNDPLKFL